MSPRPIKKPSNQGEAPKEKRTQRSGSTYSCNQFWKMSASPTTGRAVRPPAHPRRADAGLFRARAGSPRRLPSPLAALYYEGGALATNTPREADREAVLVEGPKPQAPFRSLSRTHGL